MTKIEIIYNDGTVEQHTADDHEFENNWIRLFTYVGTVDYYFPLFNVKKVKVEYSDD